MTDECWLPVVGYEGIYEVSDLGRVRSLDRIVKSRPGMTPRSRRAAGRILKLIPHSRGKYFAVGLWNGAAQMALVHVLVLEAFVGPRPDGFACCHGDGDGHNNHLDNLRWDTYSENNFDLVRHGVHHWANKTRCPSDHEYTPENTRLYMYKGTERRYCRECRRIHNRARKARLRAEGRLTANGSVRH